MLMSFLIAEDEGGRKLPEKLVRSLARNFPHGDSSDLDEYLIGRVTEYLGTHSLSLSLGSAAGERDQNGESSIESAGKFASSSSSVVPSIRTQ